MHNKVLWFIIPALLLLSPSLSGDIVPLDRLTFRNQPITDILLVLAEIGELSIIPDETVDGSASYFFDSVNFDTAFRAFLETYKLFAYTQNGITYVSRIEAGVNEETDAVSLHAEDVELRLLLRALSRAVGKTVLFDPLPAERLTVHIDGLTPLKALEILSASLDPDQYALESDEEYFYIRRLQADPLASPRRGSLVTRSAGGRYSLDLERVRFRDLLTELFLTEGCEYSLLMRSDMVLESLRFADKGFDEILRLILEQAAADFQVTGGVYYIFEIERRDILKKLKTTVILPLQHLAVSSLSGLLPAELSSSNLMRIDKNANSVILHGSPEEISPVEEFIRSLDHPLKEARYRRFELSHITVQDAINLLPPRFGLREPKIVGGANAFILPLNDAQATELSAVLEIIDSPRDQYPIQLRFITAETLLAKLPPSAAKEDLTETSDPNLIFYIGPQKRRERFLEELALIDKPVPQIRYDLLVVQYQDGESLNFSSNFENRVATEGEETTFLGSIGQLMTLNFDIVSTFGYTFAVDLSLDITEKRASIMADTTLNGLSGEDLKFQNTNTYRYRDYEIDPDTGETRSTGITRELTSGLIINLNGWVSGDGMITMEVAATVSKQGSDSSGGNPPTTTEKVVSTHVRTPSGRPVVIGGLIQQDEDYTISKIPLLGDIPLLGLLFQSRVKSVDITEMVIYVVPHIEYPEREQQSRQEEAERIYRKYFTAADEEHGRR